MILATFKNDLKSIPGHDDVYRTGITGRRWALEAEKWSLSLTHQVQYKNNEWFYGSGYYILAATDHFDLGYEDHGWYDGPHKSFSIGFLHFSWSR